MVRHRGQARWRGTADHEGKRHHGRPGLAQLFPVVIAGPEPAIHQLSAKILSNGMDARVKPGHDETKAPQAQIPIIEEKFKWLPRMSNFPETHVTACCAASTFSPMPSRSHSAPRAAMS